MRLVSVLSIALALALSPRPSAAAASVGAVRPPAAPGAAQAVPREQVEGRIVRSIVVRGNRRIGADELLSVLGVASGRPYAGREVERGLESLFRVHRVLAHVEYRPADDAPEQIELMLVIDEELERDLEPRFVGNNEVDDEEILTWAGLQAGGELYLYQASRVRERILRGYRSEGFTFAEVRIVQRSSEDAAASEAAAGALASDVIFEIKEGPKVRVRDVVFHGNESISNGKFLFFKRGLSRLAGMELRSPNFFGLFKKKFDQEVLDADVIAVRQVYRDLGFLDAVVQVERLEFDDEREWVTIHIAVDEGQQYRVRSVRIEAVERYEDPVGSGRYSERPAELLFPEQELLGLLASKPGEVFDKRTRLQDLRALRLRFGEEGYIDHPSLNDGDRMEVLDPEVFFDQVEPVIDVVHRVAQGRRQFIREVRVSGNLSTEDSVVRRLITVDPGDAADPEEIERSRQRIQGTGWFSDRRNVVEHREPYYRFIETGDPYWKDLEYVVQEGQDLNFNISGGVSSNLGAFGIVEFSKQNFDVTNLPRRPWTVIQDVAARRAFHGAGQELRLRASPGTRVSFFDAFFLEPDIFNRHRDRISLSLTARRRLRAYDTHDEAREEFGFQIGRQVGVDSSVYAGYTYGTIDVSDIDGGGEPVLNDPLAVPLTLIEQEGESKLGRVELGYRLRTTDDRISPRNGISLRWGNEIYGDATGSDYDFVKSEFAFDFYDELEGVGEEVPDRYHLEMQAGVATPYGSTDEIPYSERFFLGGQSTLRGFDFRGVGPNQKGFPLGGETFLYGSAEYRRPVVTTTQPGTYREIETMHVGVFLDAGVIGTDDFSVDFGDVRVSAGLLFGISVPLPITFSFGFPLKEGMGDDTQVLGFNIGF